MDTKNLCIICGLKEKHLDNRMCELCKTLADEKFYEIKNEFLARKYFKDHIRKDPNKTIAQPALTEEVVNDKGQTETKIVSPEKTASQVLHEKFTEKPTTEWIHGIIPSKCPFCKNLSANKGIIQTIKRDSEQYTKYVEGGELPDLVCKACGDLSLYLNHVYSFSREQSVDVLNMVRDIRKKNKDENFIACEKCAKGLGNKDEYEKIITEEEKVIMKKHNKKHLCAKCLETIDLPKENYQIKPSRKEEMTEEEKVIFDKERKKLDENQKNPKRAYNVIK